MPYIDFGTADNKATDIACGKYFSCAIVSLGTGSKVKCWGYVYIYFLMVKI